MFELSVRNEGRRMSFFAKVGEPIKRPDFILEGGGP